MWEGQPWHEFQTFPLVFIIWSQRGYFKHEACNLSVNSLRYSQSTAHRRRNRKWERGRRCILLKADCKQTCCLPLPHRRFLFWCWEVFYELPLNGALNSNFTHTCAPMSQIFDESHLAMTLVYRWHIRDRFFFFFLVASAVETQWNSWIKVKKKKKCHGMEGDKQSNTCQTNDWVSSEFSCKNKSKT